ncbi:MAG: hypothetical protein WAM60_10185 [Candidatus Promineifilaceae bacterium]
MQKTWLLRLSSKRLWLFLVLITLGLIAAERAAASGSFNSRAALSSIINTQSTTATDSNGMKDCTNTSTGLIPLIDLGNHTYHGFRGGLYPGGSSIPNQHLQRGIAAAQNIQPLNQQGQPDEAGKIIFLSLGMSNTKQSFKQFMKISRSEKDRNVALVNGAQGGYDAPRIADPESDFWTKLDSQLTRRNLSPLQVQVIWLMEATANETAPFPQDAQELQSYLRDIVLTVKDRYPNVKIIYLSSRAYGGYAGQGAPSPEPWAYEGGFAVKWLIESQIEGKDPALTYSNSPWLAWGPYTWADGLHPRSDGLTWSCNDFENDGVHPAPSGELKIANLLLNFFDNNPTTKWFPAS